MVAILALLAVGAALAAEVIVPDAPPALGDGHCYYCPPPKQRYDHDLYHKDVEVYFVEAEFLYWTIDEGGLDYAIKMNQPAQMTPSYAIGKVHSGDLTLAPGIRISTGYFNAPKYYECSGQYTHLISRGKDKVKAPKAAGEFLVGTWPQLVPNPLTQAESSLFFDYNLFDIMVDRVFIPNPHLRIRATAAATVAWIHQNWKVQYFDGTNYATLRNRWRYIGAGLKTGLMADWYWGKNIYLTGYGSTGVYIGNYRNLSQETLTEPGIGRTMAGNVKFSDTRPAIAIQVAIGPSWQQNFGACSRVELFAGYEITGWLNLQEMQRSMAAAADAPKTTWQETNMLAVQGLTVRFTVDF